jgi:uridine monophosphate synthetase
MNKKELALKLFDIGVLQFGEFTLKSGLQSPFYLDFRRIVAYPDVLREISEQLWDLVADMDFDHICGVPYAALSMSSTMAVLHSKSMIVKRKEQKKHGTKKMVEGIFKNGDSCVVIDDVISSGISMKETLESLEGEGLKINDVLSIVDRMQGGALLLSDYGYKVHTVYTVREILEYLKDGKKINQKQYTDTLVFIETNRIDFEQVRASREQATSYSYKKIGKEAKHPVAKQLTKIIQAKKTNLCCSGDVKTAQELLTLADAVGPNICMLKTHTDNLSDCSPEIIGELKALAVKHNFLIFEDRKFADIGHIVMQQFTAAPLCIADWADVVTVHVVAGSSSVEALKATGKLDTTALIVVAEMSTKDTLTDEKYTMKAMEIAEHHSDVVLGTVSQNYRSSNPGIMMLTPGINTERKKDGLGQRYNHPDEAFAKRGVDIMIVGRGIYQAENPALQSEIYRKIGWESYAKRSNEA